MIKIILFSYLVLSVLSVFLLKKKYEIKYILTLLVFLHFFLLFFRVFYPCFFELKEFTIVFVLITLIICLFLRLTLLAFFVVNFYRTQSMSSNKNSLINLILRAFMNFVEEKEILFRRIFSKTIFFNFFYYSRNFLSFFNFRILISFFFLPQILFVYFLYFETLNNRYLITVYLFSFLLIFHRVYPKFLFYSLGFGNLFHLYVNTVDNKNLDLKDFMKFTENFFSEILDIWNTYSTDIRLNLCFVFFSDNSKAADLFLQDTRKEYLLYFFPAKNSMLVAKKLSVLAKRFLSLNIFFTLTVIFCFFCQLNFFLIYFFVIIFLFWLSFNFKLLLQVFFFDFAKDSFSKRLPRFNQKLLLVYPNSFLNFFFEEKKFMHQVIKS